MKNYFINRILSMQLLFFMVTGVADSQKSIPMETLKTTGYAPVNGLKMYYEIHGEGGIPLVLIHGGGSTIQSTFGRILPLLAAKRQVIAVELQAHGRTSDRDTPESFENDAADVVALLGYLKIPKADIMGYSNGGTTALRMAIDYQQVVNKIVVVSANYRRDGMPPGFFEGMQKATLDNMPKILQDAYLEVAPDKDGLMVMFRKDVDRMLNFKDIPDDELQSIKAPAFFLSSDHDVISPDHTAKMMQLVPGAQLTILPGAHGSVLGAAESGDGFAVLLVITASLVDRFLSK